jgi:hypothetical protein
MKFIRLKSLQELFNISGTPVDNVHWCVQCSNILKLA